MSIKSNSFVLFYIIGLFKGCWKSTNFINLFTLTLRFLLFLIPLRLMGYFKWVFWETFPISFKWICRICWYMLTLRFETSPNILLIYYLRHIFLLKIIIDILGSRSNVGFLGEAWFLFDFLLKLDKLIEWYISNEMFYLIWILLIDFHFLF